MWEWLVLPQCTSPLRASKWDACAQGRGACMHSWARTCLQNWGASGK